MKRALSVAVLTALSLLVFLFIGFAQEEGAPAVPELLEQELSAMEAAYGGLTIFMAELITEVKGNMADIDAFNAKVDDYMDIVTAVSIEIKNAEGKIIGLRQDVDALGATQQELMVRVVALEAGLSELSAFADELRARLDVNVADLGALRDEFDVLAAHYAAHLEEFATFREGIYGDIDALREGIYGELSALREGIYGELSVLREGVYGDIDALRDALTADFTMLQSKFENVLVRVQALEDEDVGTFKKKVIELERSMAALAIRIDNNRAKLEGFDHAFATLSDKVEESLLQSSRGLDEYTMGIDARLAALEEGTNIQAQIDTLYFISIVALLAGVGALIWGFLGNN
ncbi:hypothetical protein ACFLSF_01225 [Candidatus Bipolaricaulota bacterium]